MAAGVREIARCPIRSARRSSAGRSQRARAAQAAGAARRRRRRLRGASERDDRLRRALPEERQRERAARLELAARSNAALAALVREALDGPGCPRARSSCSAAAARSSPSWRPAEGLVDLIIPRGGEGLKKALKEVAKVPVLYAASGNCHVYVHTDADLEMARADRLQRQGAAARASATRRRRCSSTPRSPRSSCRRRWRSSPAPGSSWSATKRRGRPRARPRSARRAPRTGTPSTTG